MWLTLAENLIIPLLLSDVFSILFLHLWLIFVQCLITYFVFPETSAHYATLIDLRLKR